MYSKKLIINNKYVLCERNMGRQCPCYVSEYQFMYIPHPVGGRPVQDKYFYTFGSSKRCKEILDKNLLRRRKPFSCSTLQNFDNDCNVRKPLPCACGAYEDDPYAICRNPKMKSADILKDIYTEECCKDYAKAYIKQRKANYNILREVCNIPRFDSKSRKQRYCKCNERGSDLQYERLPKLELRSNQPNLDIYKAQRDLINSTNLSDFLEKQLRLEVPEPEYLYKSEMCDTGSKTDNCPAENTRHKRVEKQPALPCPSCYEYQDDELIDAV